MKRIYIPALAALLLGATACNDILDIEPTTQYGEEAIWHNQTTADYYIMASYQLFDDYSQFQNLTSRFYDANTDLFKSTIWDAGNEVYNKCFILGDRLLKNSASMFDCWGTGYGRIKRANLLLNSLEKHGPKFQDEKWCKVREAEIRFCRALNYFFMARVYGGLVKRTDHSGINGFTDDGACPEDCNRARMTEEETYQFIIDEMQWCADALEGHEWKGDTEVGRATPGMIYGFMSRVALYGKMWDVAAQAARKCEELGKYSLVEDYAKLFDHNNNADNRKEILYALYYKKDLKIHSYDSYMRSPGDFNDLNKEPSGRVMPTAELADCFEWKDGIAFSWSNWKKAGAGHTDPYTDREPRFQATILYDGAKWQDREIQSYVGYTSSVPDGKDKYTAWEAASSTRGYTPTGYYMRKYLVEGLTDWITYGSINTEIMMRFGEVLLNEAEALAMQGKIQEALVPLNRIRSRVQLPAKTLEDAPTVEAFMKILRNERICELAGEGFRYWDLIRWGLAQEVIDGQSYHGVLIKLSAKGAKSYTTVDCDGGRTRMFPERYYRLSLPAAELTNNKLCVDNPLW